MCYFEGISLKIFQIKTANANSFTNDTLSVKKIIKTGLIENSEEMMKEF